MATHTLFKTHFEPLTLYTRSIPMTRTARKKTREPFPATPWEKLRVEKPLLDQNKVKKIKKGGLKVTQQEKLGPNLPERVKKKIKKATGKQLRSSLSDKVALLEFDENESMHKDVIKRRGRESSKSNACSKRRKRMGTAPDMRTAETNTHLKCKKRKNLRSRKSKKRRTTSGDRVPLLHSDSDSSLSDEREKGFSRDCEDSDSGDDVEEVNVGEGGQCDQEEVESEMSEEVTSKKKRNKKVLSRVRVGKHWVKAGSGQSFTGQGVSVLTGEGEEGEGEKGGEGATGKTKRRIDEEKRKKRIEHRRLRRQRKKVNPFSQYLCSTCGSEFTLVSTSVRCASVVVSLATGWETVLSTPPLLESASSVAPPNTPVRSAT